MSPEAPELSMIEEEFEDSGSTKNVQVSKKFLVFIAKLI
jgi:hypothetical protein